MNYISMVVRVEAVQARALLEARTGYAARAARMVNYVSMLIRVQSCAGHGLATSAYWVRSYERWAHDLHKQHCH